MTSEEARAELARHAGTQFDPQVVFALIATLGRDSSPDSPERS
jgi:HD-GYP domain-containing protein (c-di-GMP phosphodiesterase class II)